MKLRNIAGCSSVAAALMLGSSWVHADAAAEKEAEEYMQTWEDRGKEACKDNERGCAAAGHALDRAAAAYEKAGKLDKAIAIRKMILDPQWHLDYTDYGRMATFKLAQNMQSIAEYGEAAQLAETAVRRFAKSDEAPDASRNAVTLRVGLGEIDKAIDDLQIFSKNYGAIRAGEIPKMVLAIATALWDHGQAKESREFIEKWRNVVEKSGNLHERILTHALLGRIYARERAPEKAAKEFEVVRAAWQKTEEAVKRLNALGGPEVEQIRRLAQSVTAVGEAQFFFAEQKRAEVEAIRFPEYTGSGNKESVVNFVGTKIAVWMRDKRSAIELAEREYQKVLELQPVPPPRWVIASAGRVGFMWSAFTSDFRRAPMPKEWSSKAPLPGTSIPGTEIKKLYLEQLGSMSEPLLQRSKQAFLVCVNHSVKYQWFDEHAQACVDWLEKRFPKEWIKVEELRPQPIYSALPISTAIISPP
ncbi:MAG TPA: hypothetical protein PK156_08805 [Polyangium sp.]|nr:hypothetical protein [Polyangium sp.]